jgi:nucleotide-binding universal stress UspA family protein
MHARTSRGDDAPSAGREAVFERVLVGIDSTDESLVAAAQAGVLRAPSGSVVLLAAVERHLASHAGLLSARAEDDLAASASIELDRARELVEPEDAVLVPGSLVQLLRSQCERRRATLIAVGVRPHRRLGALTFGGHDVEALHDLDCSVLIARPGWGPAKPQRIVVGVDGSHESLTAERVGRALARRLDCEVVPVIGLGEDVDLQLLRRERDDALVHPGPLVDGVVAASSPRSLVVVGRARQVRGRRRWGGGLGERVVYAVKCSVLVLDDDVEAPSADG